MGEESGAGVGVDESFQRGRRDGADVVEHGGGDGVIGLDEVLSPAPRAEDVVSFLGAGAAESGQLFIDRR